MWFAATSNIRRVSQEFLCNTTHYLMAHLPVVEFYAMNYDELMEGALKEASKCRGIPRKHHCD